MSDLIPTQEYTGAAKAKSIGEEFDPKKAEVAVIEKGGKYYIHDGHHTAAAAKYAGQKSIKATVYVAGDDLEEGPPGFDDYGPGPSDDDDIITF